jgi:hypothetical protein
MELRLLDLDVDGTLRNPVVIATVVLWSGMLSGVTVLLVRWMLGARPQTEPSARVRRLLALPALAVLFLATPLAHHLIGNLIYHVQYMKRGVSLSSVGFWGGPPTVPPWLAAAACGVVYARRRMRRRDAPSRE